MAAAGSAPWPSPGPPSARWPTSCAWWSSTRAAAAAARARRRSRTPSGRPTWMAGGSYGGFIAMEYAIAYPGRVRAMILRDTSPDNSNLERAYENARNQDRIEINWDNFNRYWGGEIRDDEDLKARWAEIIPLYDFEYDAERSAARVEAGIYRYEAHNWCFQHNMPGFDLKPQLPGVRCPTLVTVGRTDWITPVASAETIAALIPDSRLVIFEKSGHSPQIEEADKFQAVLRDFIREVLG